MSDTNAGASQHTKPLHIAFGVDENFFHPMGVTITSIVACNPDVDLVFHVFAPHVSKDNSSRLKSLERKFGREIRIHEVDQSFLEQFSPYAHISTAAFIRLLIAAALQRITDKVLYIDADILCVGSLAELVTMDIGDSIAAVVSDSKEKSLCARLSLSHEKYFNSGFMYINIGKWLAANITQSVVDAKLSSGNNFIWADQDALNFILDGRVKYIESKWNSQCELWKDLQQGKSRMHAPDDSVLVHFIGSTKPWFGWLPHDATRLFKKYQAASTWSDFPLVEKMHYKDMRRLSRMLRKQGRYMDSVKWFGRYVACKYSRVGTI